MTLPVFEHKARQTASRAVGRTASVGPPGSAFSGATGAAPFLQFKLSVSSPADPLEQEADRVAEHVLGASETTPKVSSAGPQMQRACAKCHEEEAQIQMKAHAAGNAGSAPAHVAGKVGSLIGGGGSPLPSLARSYFEPRFGEGFGDVRIHSGAEARQVTDSLHARAFTLGSNIVFGSGEPGNGDDGTRLLAHELTHVVQQRGGTRS